MLLKITSLMVNLHASKDNIIDVNLHAFKDNIIDGELTYF